MKAMIDRDQWQATNIVIISFVGLSLFMQFLMATVLVFIAKENEFIDEKKRNMLIRKNNLLSLLALCIAIVNIFTSVFLMV